jgi:hypothetical protein
MPQPHESDSKLHHIKGPRPSKTGRRSGSRPWAELAQARVDKMVAPAPAGGQNRPIGPQFDGNIQISARHIKRVESLDEDGPRPQPARYPHNGVHPVIPAVRIASVFPSGLTTAFTAWPATKFG